VLYRFQQMRTVTNLYLFNLAVSDFLFLCGLPIAMTTFYYRKWVFDGVTCKLFYLLTSSNWFAEVFTITVLSADRLYLAVCKSSTSSRYRSNKITHTVCLVVWIVSVVVMLPIIIYATTTIEDDYDDVTCSHYCLIDLPKIEPLSNQQAFVLYSFVLAFIIPVPLISFFYFSVLKEMTKAGAKKTSSQVKRSKKKVTTMVLSVITLYVVCWLPYWIFQFVVVFVGVQMQLIAIILNILCYANSSINPLLYAFLSESFRKNFLQLFACFRCRE
ncbi:hypothetical protein HELRODRAFT_122299, partial [Helobdella robusta]|uniref:G-protein coupled receptors family 1 profile domain-containing protein n=1 Tax=Helobdella robusta TaxID=6412 RepID=T1EGU4_HELRO